MKSFGVKKQSKNVSKIDEIIEELTIKGYAIVENVLSREETFKLKSKIDFIYDLQKEEMSEKDLEVINEKDLVRLPLAYDSYFLEIASNKLILKIMKSIFGDYFILNLQNAIINRPKEDHHQHSWHRDLPYQDFVSNEPLAINAMFCLDAFNKNTGGTKVIPFSHKLTQMPSEEYILKNEVFVEANEGDLVIFDSMIYHCAGYNSSNIIRRGLNNMYSIPIIKQQFDLANIVDLNLVNGEMQKILGFNNVSFRDVISWRKSKISKLKT